MYQQVDPTAPPNPQFYVQQGLPYSPPVVPNVQVGQNMQQFLPAITGYAMMAIQQTVQKNQLRAFYFNLVSRNGWQNPDFETLVVGVAQLAEFFVATNGGRVQPEQAVQQAAQEMVGMLTSMNAWNHQNALAQFVNPAMVQDLQNQVAKFQQYEQQLKQFYSAPANTGFGGGFGGNTGGGFNTGFGGGGGNMMGGGGFGGGFAGNRGGGGGATIVGANRGPVPLNQMWGNQNQNTGVNMAANRGGSNAMWGSNQFGGNVNAPQDTSFGGGIGRRKTGAVEEVTLTSEGAQFRTIEPKATPKFADRDVAPAPMSASPFKTHLGQTAVPDFVPLSADAEWPKIKDPTRPWDAILLADGTETRPAHISKWDVSYNEERPYHLVYDPTKYMLFHVRTPEGDVYETLHERTDDMEYLDHELDPKLKAQVREARKDDSQVVAPNWGLAQALRPHPLVAAAVPMEPESETEASVDITSEKPRVLEDVIQAHSLQEAEVKVSLLDPGDANLRALQAPLEFYYDHVNPVPVEKNEINTVRALDNCLTYPELRQKMAECKPRLPETLWNIVDKRLAGAFNEAMEKNLGLSGWKIDSFFEDYEDLTKLLKEDYSEDFVLRFEDHAPQLIGGTLSVLSGEAFAKYLRSVRGDAEGGDSGQHLLVFRDRCSVTYVPWKFDELHLDLTQGGMVPESQMPELYAALEAIFARTEDHPVTFSRRYLMTADKKLIEVRRGYLGKDSILLFPAK